MAEAPGASLEERVREQYRTLRMGVFSIYYHPADQAYAMTAASALETARRRIAENLGLRDDFRNSRVVIAWDARHFQELAGAGFPHWGAACANSERRLIVMKSPRWSNVDRDPGETIRHEMAHLGTGILTRGNWIPVWLSEGIAVVESGMPRGLATGSSPKMSLSKALSSGGLIALGELESLHGYGDMRADLAYTEAESAVRFFLERHGRVALIQLLTHVGRGVDFAEAFDRVSGGAYYRFEDEWVEWLKKNFGSYFLLDVSSWIWILIVLLLVAGWVARRFRTRRILATWDAEQDDEL